MRKKMIILKQLSKWPYYHHLFSQRLTIRSQILISPHINPSLWTINSIPNLYSSTSLHLLTGVSRKIIYKSLNRTIWVVFFLKFILSLSLSLSVCVCVSVSLSLSFSLISLRLHWWIFRPSTVQFPGKTE